MPAAAPFTNSPELPRIHAVLDDFHAAASGADEERYVAHLAPGAVFLGTAPGERWAGEAFRAFVHSHFSAGRGWTYVPSNRFLAIAPDGVTAWFDEELDNNWYGTCRGTGVLRLYEHEWKLEHYSLGIPVPDELAADLVARIRERAGPRE